MGRVDRKSDGSGLSFVVGYMIDGVRHKEDGPGTLLDLLPVDANGKVVKPKKWA